MDSFRPPGTPPLPAWSLKAMVRIATIATAGLAMLPFQLAIIRFMSGRAHVIPRLFHSVICASLGIRITVQGQAPVPGTRALIVANHVSWLDVPVIGKLQSLSFVAKSEISGWPVIGLLARLQNTVFIDRSRRSATAEASSQMGERLMNGDSIVLFAEGTTGDGTRLKPLRSSLLGDVRQALGDDDDQGEIKVHPLAITYVGRHGIPGGRAGRARLAWYGDTELAPHLREVLNGGPIDVRLVWGEPIAMGRGHSRKETTLLAEQAIRHAVAEAITGRVRD